MDYTTQPTVVVYEYNNKEDIVVHTKHSDTDKESIFIHMKKDVSNKPYLHMQYPDFEKIRYKYRDSIKIVQHHALSRELKDKIDVCLLAIRTKKTNKTVHVQHENNKRTQVEQSVKENTRKPELFVVNFFIHHYDGSKTEHEETFFPDSRGMFKKLHVNIHLPRPVEIIKEIQAKKTFSIFNPTTWFN
jgi:hypothetical protein